MFKIGPIAKATLQTSFVLVVRLLLQAGTILLIARLLGSEQFGIFAGIASLAVILGAFSTFGTHLVFLADISKKLSKRINVLSYAVPTTILNGCILFLAYLLIVYILFGNHADYLLLIFCIGFAEIILMPLLLFPAAEQLAKERIAFSQIITIYPLFLRFFAVLGIMLCTNINILNALAYSYLVVAILSLLTVKLLNNEVWVNFKLWKKPSYIQLKESSGYAVLALTATAPTEFDKMLAAKLLPLGVSGVYVVASRIIGAATLPVIALLLSAMPRLFREGRNQSKIVQKNSNLSKWIFIFVFIYSIVLMICLFFLSPIFELLFGIDYLGLSEMLRWMSLIIPGLALRIAAGSILMTQNFPWFRAGFEAGGVFCMLITSYIFIQLFGYLGMVYAIACSEWFMAIVGILMVIRFSNSSVD